MDTPTNRRLRWSGLILIVAVAVAAMVAVTLFMLPVHTTRPADAGDPVIAAAGDIACDPRNRNFKDGNGSAGSCRQQAVSDLLVDSQLTAVLALGDIQYYCASHRAFLDSYDKSWGRVKDITHPVPGNHEYLAAGTDNAAAGEANTWTGCDIGNKNAAGYYQYFGAAAGDVAKGYYSFDLGTWHIVAINSSCSHSGGCRADSPQLTWLREDLAAHPTRCTLAFWHHPRFSSGKHGSDADYAPLWDALYAAGVEVVLNGHEHIYERFAPQKPTTERDDQHGIRQFTVGTGGANHTDVVTTVRNSEVHETTTFGVLKMTLHPDSYDWEFVPEKGRTFTDSGTDRCHGSPT